MAIRTVMIYRPRGFLYSLTEMVNNRIKSLELDKAEVLDVQFQTENKAYIVYEI